MNRIRSRDNTPMLPEPPPLHAARVVFTGRLATIAPRIARQLVVAAGGRVQESVSRRTSCVVVGMGGWPLRPDGHVSVRLQRAETLIAAGARIRIVSEAEFLELVGRRPATARGKARYTAEEIAAQVGVPEETLRRWAQLSLLRAIDGGYDFRDLVSLRAIAELVGRGVRPEVIARSLVGLARVLPEVERPLAQLRIVMDHPGRLLAELDARLVAADGQLFLNFDALEESPRQIAFDAVAANATAWCARGAWLAEQERWAESAAAYDQARALDRRSAAAHCGLGLARRELGQRAAAAEAYRMAAAHDAECVEAWRGLAEIRAEQGRLREAVDAWWQVLRCASQDADAHFDMAVCLEQLGERDAAAEHWRRFVELDPDAPAAELARTFFLSLPVDPAESDKPVVCQPSDADPV